jgi:hypothetical protein
MKPYAWVAYRGGGQKGWKSNPVIRHAFEERAARSVCGKARNLMGLLVPSLAKLPLCTHCKKALRKNEEKP